MADEAEDNATGVVYPNGKGETRATIYAQTAEEKPKKSTVQKLFGQAMKGLTAPSQKQIYQKEVDKKLKELQQEAMIKRAQKEAEDKFYGPKKTKTKFEMQDGYLVQKSVPETELQKEISRINAMKQAQALEEAGQAYQSMKYIPSMAQPRVKQISEQIRGLKKFATKEGIFGRNVMQNVQTPVLDAKGRVRLDTSGKPVFKTEKKMVFQPGLVTKGAERMEAIAGGIAAAPKRFAGSFQGARSYEKKLGRTKSLSTGVAGFLFPQTGLQKRIRSAGFKRGSAGRPAGVYTHVIPGVGPVHVYVWRKWVRAQKRKAQEAMQMREDAMAQQLAKRGLPPDIAYMQAEQYQQARRQRAIEAAPELAEEIAGTGRGTALMQQYYQIPAQMPQQYQQMQPQPPQAVQMAATNQLTGMAQPSRAPINMLGPDRLSNVFTQNQQSQPAPPGYTEHYDIFSGRKTIVPKNEPTERWARDSSSISRPGMIGVRRANPNQNIMQMQGGIYYQ